MIRLTRQADYGIVVMTYFARVGETETHTARDVAGEIHLPLPMVSKILKCLARGGLLTSHRGVNGGYNLERAPEEVSVADVITALEGPINMTTCTDDDSDCCEIDEVCNVKGNWQLVNQVVRQALENITLEHMAAPMPCSLEQLVAQPPSGERLPQAGALPHDES
jgi:FeS assembly SUF system regulator